MQLDGQIGLVSVMERLASNRMAFMASLHVSWKFGFLLIWVGRNDGYESFSTSADNGWNSKAFRQMIEMVRY